MPLPHPKLTEALAKTDLVIFDNDGVTYPWTNAINDQYGLGQLKAMVELSSNQLTLHMAAQMADISYKQYGHPHAWFFNTFGVDPRDFHLKAHVHFDEKVIQPDPSLPAAFEGFRTPRAVLTHGANESTWRILNHLGVAPHFERDRIFALEDVGLNRKEISPAPYRHVLDATGAQASRAAMTEDSPANLVHPKRMGMTTILIADPRRITPRDVPHVDFIVPDLHTFLAAASTAQPALQADSTAENGKRPPFWERWRAKGDQPQQ